MAAPNTAPNAAVYSFRLLDALREGDPKVLQGFLSKEDGSRDKVNELTSPLHIAVRCAEYKTVQLCLSFPNLRVNVVDAEHGNTPLHVASALGRPDVVQLLLEQKNIDDTKRNVDGKDAMDVAHTPAIAQLFQVSRAQLNVRFIDILSAWEQKLPNTDQQLSELLQLPRVKAIDLNVQTRSGSTLLHEAVARKDTQMIETALQNGADVYARNRRGKSALDSAKDEKIKALLRQYSNADAAMATQAVSGQPPTFRGYLAKWTNLAGGYKTRWFVLHDGILSYYHSAEEEGKQSRGSVNLRFAKIRADGNDKHRFEIVSDSGSKGTSKLYLRGSHPVERARWVQVLQQTQDFFNLERTISRSESVIGAPGAIGSAPSLAGSSTNVSSVPSRTVTPALGKRPTSTTNALAAGTPSMTLATPMAARAEMGFARTPSLVSRESLHSDKDDSDGIADAEPLFDSAGRPKVPHSESLPLLVGSLKLKVDLAQELARSFFSASAERVSSATVASTGSAEEIKASLQDALSQITSLFDQYSHLVEERETYLLRRYEQEIAIKRLWEGHMKTLAEQHAEIETQLQEVAQDNARQRKALREARGGMITSPVPGNLQIVNPKAQRAADISGTNADRREGAQPLQLDSLPVAGAGAGPELTSMDSADEEDEFFDVVESGNLPGLVIETPLAEKPKEQDWPEDFDQSRINDASIEPYRHLRSRLPIGKDERPSVSLWAILKNNIGKDLTKISFPVSFNEPTSMLQRMAEDMEFSECLDAAVTQEDSTKRIAFIAAFAMSNYSSTIGRIAKPFNPLLGETFEYIRPDKHYRYVSEQVSHHPPVSACVAQSPLWEYMGCVDAKSKFLGRTFEIRPTGVAHVKLNIPSNWAPKGKKLPTAQTPGDRVIEHYTWNKVTTSVSGFIVGSPTIDHVGDLTVENHATGDKCTLTFKPRGWRGGNAREISGSVWDGKGNLQWEIAGRWDSQLIARKVGSGAAGTMDPDQSFKGEFSAEPQPSAEYLLLWRNSVKAPNTPFNLTPFAMTLNDLPDKLSQWLPPTDCRVRPDLVSFEEGRFDEANGLKQNLEDYQRSTRRKREAGELPPHEPRWFTKTVDSDSGETLWKPTTVEDTKFPGMPQIEYWSQREKSGSTGDKDSWRSEHIYGPFESKRVK